MIRLMTKYRFNIQAAPEDSDTKLTEAISDKVLKTARERDETKN